MLVSCWGLKDSKAPLAQSVERFHGKEKVNGSIPLGGSVVSGERSDGRRQEQRRPHMAV